MDPRAPFKPPRFIRLDYINASTAVVMHEVLTDMMTDEVLQVVGHPEDGTFEWIVLNKTRVIAHSNSGYCSTRSALRDGLLASLGYPTEAIEVISHAHICDTNAKPKVYPSHEEPIPTPQPKKSRRRA